MLVEKQDGRVERFDRGKIVNSVSSVIDIVYSYSKVKENIDIAQRIGNLLAKRYKGRRVEQIRSCDIYNDVSTELMKAGQYETARMYLLYPVERKLAMRTSWTDVQVGRIVRDIGSSEDKMLAVAIKVAENYALDHILRPSVCVAYRDQQIGINALYGVTYGMAYGAVVDVKDAAGSLDKSCYIMPSTKVFDNICFAAGQMVERAMQSHTRFLVISIDAIAEAAKAHAETETDIRCGAMYFFSFIERAIRYSKIIQEFVEVVLCYSEPNNVVLEPFISEISDMIEDSSLLVKAIGVETPPTEMICLNETSISMYKAVSVATERASAIGQSEDTSTIESYLLSYITEKIDCCRDALRTIRRRFVELGGSTTIPLSAGIVLDGYYDALGGMFEDGDMANILLKINDIRDEASIEDHIDYRIFTSGDKTASYYVDFRLCT